MTLDNRTKPIIGIVIAVVVILGLIALTGKKEPGITPESAPVTAETSAPAEEATQEAEETAGATGPALSSEGLYSAECIVGGGTMVGQVEVDEDDHPSAEKTISIKNMNTGKSTKVDMAGANCVFTPIEK